MKPTLADKDFENAIRPLLYKIARAGSGHAIHSNQQDFLIEINPEKAALESRQPNDAIPSPSIRGIGYCKHVEHVTQRAIYEFNQFRKGFIPRQRNRAYILPTLLHRLPQRMFNSHAEHSWEYDLDFLTVPNPHILT